MVILSLHLVHFGRFQDRNISLRPGINIINGDNESGKSTVAAFIKAMLYGLPEGSAECRRYEPHDRDGSYGGSMQVLYEERLYEITRSFVPGAQSLSVRQIGAKALLPDPEAWMSELCSGMTCAEFERSGYVTRDALSLDREIFGRPLLTADERKAKQMTEHYARAEQYLQQKKDHYLGKVDPDLPDTQTDLLEKLEVTEEARKKLDGARPGLLLRLSERKQALSDEQAEIAAENAARKEGYETRVQETSEEVTKISADLDRINRKKPVAGIILTALGLVLLAATWFFLASYDYNLTDLYVRYLGGACALVSVLLLLSGVLLIVIPLAVWKKKRNAVSLQLAGKNAEYAEAREKRKYYLEHEDEENRHLPEPEKREEEILSLTEQAEENRVRLQERTELSDKLKFTIARNEERLKMQDEILWKVQAIDMALSSFSDLSGQKGTKKQPFDLLSVNAYFEALGSGAGDEIRVNADDLLVLQKDDTEIPFQELSVRASEEVLLAIRLAMLSEKDPGKCFPLVLDDVFASYDTERLNNALSLLRSLDRQIVLLSCHKRERQAL